jgi:hypothetical protein
MYVTERREGRMDPRYRSRLVAAVIIMMAVCSAFSVSPVAGFRLENRDGTGAGAALAESLVLQESTKIKEEYLTDVTVYIDSKSEKFAPYSDDNGSVIVSGIYSPEEDAIYIRSDIQPETADETLVQQLGYRVFLQKGLKNSTVLPELYPEQGSYLNRANMIPGEITDEKIFANAFMLYHKYPTLLEGDNPDMHRYIDLLVTSGGDAAMVDDLYLHYDADIS